VDRIIIIPPLNINCIFNAIPFVKDKWIAKSRALLAIIQI